MFVCMWVHIKLSCSAYVAKIYEVQKQAGGQAEEHCLLEQNEQQGPLNTPKHSKYEHHPGWMEEEEGGLQGVRLHAEGRLHHSALRNHW